MPALTSAAIVSVSPKRGEGRVKGGGFKRLIHKLVVNTVNIKAVMFCLCGAEAASCLGVSL